MALWHPLAVPVVTAYCVTGPERSIGKYVKNVVALKQKQSEPVRTVNLYCCLQVAVADVTLFPLRVRVSHKEPQHSPVIWERNVFRIEQLAAVRVFQQSIDYETFFCRSCKFHMNRAVLIQVN